MYLKSAADNSSGLIDSDLAYVQSCAVSFSSWKWAVLSLAEYKLILFTGRLPNPKVT